MQALIGKTVGHYEILEYVARGGMGEVYRAHDQRLDRVVAVKAIREELISDPQAKRLFVDEARMTSKVVHPYVATVFDVVESNDRPFLVMEFIEGRHLGDVLAADPPSTATLTRYALEITEALAAIHEAGLVHRDLKPGNIMIARDGHAKVMDFGLSAIHQIEAAPDQDPSTMPTASAEHVVRGTLAYMAPEQLRAQPPDSRSDLFSLGVILYQAITGKHPFRRGSDADTVSAILSQPPDGDPGAKRRLAQAGTLGRIALRLLKKEPERRYQNTRDLAEDLRALQEGRPPGFLAGAWSFPLLHPALVALVAVAVIILAGAIGWWSSGKMGERSRSRVAVAVLPFEDRTGEAVEDLQGAMIADVLAARLSASPWVRSVPQHRVTELLEALPGGEPLSERLSQVARGVKAEWLLAGTLYREAGEYVSTVQVQPSGDLDSGTSFTVRAPQATLLARRAAERAEEWIAGPDRAELERSEVAVLYSESDEAQRLFQRATQLDGELRYAEALGFLERAIGLDAGFIRARLAYADLLHRVGFERKAMETVDRAGELVDRAGLPEAGRAVLELEATRARIHNRNAESIKSYQALAELFPDEPENYRRLAEVLRRQRRFDEALKALDAALELDHLDPQLYLDRAKTLASIADRRREAEQALEEAERLFEFLAITGGRSSAAGVRGYLRQVAGDPDAAVAQYRLAARLYREQGLELKAMDAVYDEATVELSRWRLAEAEQRFGEVLPVAREAGHYSLVLRVENALGALLLRQHRLDEAREVLLASRDEAIKLGNESLEGTAGINLAGVLNRMQRPEEARRYARETLALARRRDNPARIVLSMLRLADADRRQGRLADAGSELGALASGEAEPRIADSERAYAWQSLVVVAEDSEQPNLALDAADRAVRLTRELDLPVRVAYSLALRSRVLSGLGRLDDAAEDLAEAERLLGPDRSAPVVLERLQLARAGLALARDDREAAIEFSASANAGVAYPDVPPMLDHAEALLASGRTDEAGTLALRVVGYERATPMEQTRARLLHALCLTDTERAAAEALEAFDAAGSMGLSLTAARAAALVYSLQSSLAGREEMLERAGREWQNFLRHVPEDRRQWIRTRRDVSELLKILGGDGAAAREAA